MTETQNQPEQRPVGGWVDGRAILTPMCHMVLLSAPSSDVAPGLRGRGGSVVALDEISAADDGESIAPDGHVVVGTITITVINPRLYRILAGWRRPSRGYRKHIRRKKATRK